MSRCPKCVLIASVLAWGCDRPSIPQVTTPPPAEVPQDERQQLATAYQDALSHGDPEEAIRALEGLRGLEPENRELLAQLANLYTQWAGHEIHTPRRVRAVEAYLLAGERFREWLRLGPEPSEAQARAASVFLYNEACGRSLRGDTSGAMDSLDDAFRLGFRELPRGPGQESSRELLMADPDLDATRAAEPGRFGDLVRRYFPEAAVDTSTP